VGRQSTDYYAGGNLFLPIVNDFLRLQHRTLHLLRGRISLRPGFDVVVLYSQPGRPPGDLVALDPVLVNWQLYTALLSMGCMPQPVVPDALKGERGLSHRTSREPLGSRQPSVRGDNRRAGPFKCTRQNKPA
jgi:hypothetical protein